APLNATQMMEQLNTSSPAGEQPSVKSAFELLGRTPVTAPPVQQDSNEVMLRALAAALSGDKKSLPQWNGNVESLRPWLRSLSLWELDNHLPKQRWGLKLLQSFPEGSVPRKVAEALDLTVLSSDHGYSAILSAILTKYGPYLEAAGPAAVENFFYGSERNRSESLATYIAAKEIALAELESQVGEKVPPRIAGRILLRHANLSETQKEALAIKYNSLLPFEQMAAALRPLDRPEALVHRVAKTFLAAGSKDDEEAAEEVDYEDEELVPDEDWEEGPESDGEGGMNYLLFDTHQEYTEEEANYIWAYNSAYKDIRKELQARRKGRQFYKPKGRSVAKGSGKKGKHKSRKGKPSAGNRGTPEDLMVNSVLVNVSSEVQKCVQIFAGVKTEGTEAIVDTAAEEGVIGSNAMRRLREALSRFKLQPVEASGSTVSCAGIGGSARIVGIFDIPIGVARCNSLIRVTEIADEGNFETPFLLPISYIELVGGVVDTGRNIFTLKNGRRTPMRRTPSGHRAISVVEFSGQWKLPPQLADELGAKDRNPFHMDIAGERNRVQQRPGVAVWVKEGQVVTFVGTLPGPRDTLVHPSECLSPAELPHISGRRVTHAVFDDDIASNIHDLWTGQQRQFPFWSGDVVFERFERFSPPVDVADTPHPPLEPQDGVQVRPASGEATATASHRTAPEVGDLEKELCFQSLQGDGALSSSQRKSKCEYFDLSHPLSAPNSSSRLQICVSAQARDDQEDQDEPNPHRKMGSKRLMEAWRRMGLMILNLIVTSTQRSAMEYLMQRNTIQPKSVEAVKEKPKSSKKIGDGKIRRGIGQELKRSSACKTWRFEPQDCAHEEDQLRQRAGRGQHWWTCLACGSRWERLEWAEDKAFNTGAQSSTDPPPTTLEVFKPSKVAYPKTLPAPRHSQGIPALQLEEIIESPAKHSSQKPSKQNQGRIPADYQTADERLDGMLKSHMGPKEAMNAALMNQWPTPRGATRRTPSSGVREIQEMQRPRTPRISDRVEVHAIHSSDEEVKSSGVSSFSVTSP
ncbi:Leucyl/phenylalanyl-tRNA--protein transferase, partial [Durusdinium trenchii]